MLQELQLHQLQQHRAVCPFDCPDTCGMIVTVDAATRRAVKLGGDPDHPFTRGFLCRKVNNYLDRIYHAERLLHPLKRVGAKGSGQFERITWDEAIDTIVKRLRAVVNTFGAQSVLPYSYAGTMGKVQGSSLDRRFFHRLGASLLDRTICATAGGAACEVTFGPGKRAVVDPDAVAEQVRYIVNWGSNTIVTNTHFWVIEHEARQRGAKIVTIDPHRSKTAEKSDWWLPIRPGTDGALALGVMHILFRDGLHDQDYLDRYCDGGEQLRERALNEYTPAKVSHITGLSTADIEQFAKEYGRAKELFGGPALLRVNYGLQRHGGGGMAMRTITCLPAITGDWRYPGAGALLSTSKEFPFDSAALERPDLIRPGTRTINMTQLAEALHGELGGPPVNAMIVYNSNPASIAPDQSRVVQGLARDDLFLVVLEHFVTDTARYADIVLPATQQLEHWDIHSAYGHLYVQANPPALPAPGECLPNTEIFRRLAAAMGFERELFAMSDEELCRLSMKRGGGFEGLSFDDLRTGEPRRLSLPKDWAPYAHGGFGTANGKCNLWGTLPPTYVPPHEDPLTRPELASKYPLQLITPPDPAFLNSTFVEVEHLRAQAVRPTVELHTFDAASRGIAEGDAVEVFNDRGQYRATAKVGDGVKRGVVVSLGCWWSRHTHDGANHNTLTSTALTDLGGGATFFDSLVDVRRAV
jgi:anaerobic selenocysteine-containing dehydrogenase